MLIGSVSRPGCQPNTITVAPNSPIARANASTSPLAIPRRANGRLTCQNSDATSGRETYGACRFLYFDIGPDGAVELDFNKAVSPPCAFTEFATCPLPPPQNRLPFPVPAGELAPEGH